MRMKKIAIAMLMAGSLAGCDVGTPAVELRTSVLGTPALPVIQEAVTSLSPTFNGKRVPILVNQLCALARGQLTTEQSNVQLAKMGIDASKLQHQGPDALALLVNGDRTGQATACAAYQVLSVLTPLSPSDVLREVPVSQAHVDKSTVAQKKGNDTQARQYILDDDAASKLFRLRIAQARASADSFAYIAEQLAKTPGLTLVQYQDKARQLFSSMAPAYISLVQQYLPVAMTAYHLNTLSELETDFTSDAGMRYQVSRVDGLTFTLNGQLWLGRGQILGSHVRLPVAYFTGNDKVPASDHP